MKKQFFLSLLLNLGIIFLILSGVTAYQKGNPLIVGASIALIVVLIYLKIVLLKHVKLDFNTKKAESQKKPVAKKETKKQLRK